MYVYMCVYVCMYIYMYVCMCVYACVYHLLKFSPFEVWQAAPMWQKRKNNL